MASFLIVLIVGVACLCLMRTINKTLISVSGIFVAMWTITLSLSCLGFYDMNPPSVYVVSMGLLAIIVFTLFSIFYNKKYYLNDKNDELYDQCSSTKPLSKKLWIFVLTIAAYIYVFPFLLKSIDLISNHGWSYLRYASGLDSYGSTAQRMIMQYFVQTLFIVTLLVTCIDIVSKKPYIPAIIISLLDAVIYSTLFGGRYIFLYLLVFAGFLLIRKARRRVFRVFRMHKKTSIFIALIVLVMVWLTLQRSSNSFWKSLYIYFCGSYSYLSYLIDKELITNLHLMGLNQIGFVYNFFYSAFTAVFGINYQGTNHIITQITAETVSLGGTIKYNALGTCLESFVCDFGLLGAPIGIVLYAFTLHFVERAYLKNKNSVSLALYLIVVFSAVNSVFSYSFSSPGMFVTIILIFFFAKTQKKQGRHFLAFDESCKHEGRKKLCR